MLRTYLLTLLRILI